MSTKDEKREVKERDANVNMYEEQRQFIISKGIEDDLEDMDRELEDYYQSV